MRYEEGSWEPRLLRTVRRSVEERQRDRHARCDRSALDGSRGGPGSLPLSRDPAVHQRPHGSGGHRGPAPGGLGRLKEVHVHASGSVLRKDPLSREIAAHARGVRQHKIRGTEGRLLGRSALQHRVVDAEGSRGAAGEEKLGIGREQEVPAPERKRGQGKDRARKRNPRTTCGSLRNQDGDLVTAPDPDLSQLEESTYASVDAQVRERQRHAKRTHRSAEFTFALRRPGALNCSAMALNGDRTSAEWLSFITSLPGVPGQEEEAARELKKAFRT